MTLLRRSGHAAASDVGRRTENQDRAATLAVGKGVVVAAVADGMGGARAGGDASEAAMSAFLAECRSFQPGCERMLLGTGFRKADQAVSSLASGERKGMGTTLVAAIVRENQIWAGNIGDSRAVLVAGDEVISLSAEHSVVGDALREGKITEIEALNHPYRHAISRALGEGDSVPEIRFRSVASPTQTPAVVILGSDGLFRFVGDAEILELVGAQGRSASDLVRALVLRALRNGSDDNVSAAAVFIDPPQPERRVRTALIGILFACAVAGVAIHGSKPLESFSGFSTKAVALTRSHPATAHARTPASPIRMDESEKSAPIGQRSDDDALARFRVARPAGELDTDQKGTLCLEAGDCFASWRVVETSDTELVIEIQTPGGGL
jgi:serine/threonine protein phosphatase PrpC